MPRIDAFLNHLADANAGWWPFLHLRPARHERMDARCLLRMSLRYGTLMGAAIYAWYVFIGFLQLSVLWPIACAGASAAFFFAVVKSTFAIAWNRRAARLAGQAGAGSDSERDLSTSSRTGTRRVPSGWILLLPLGTLALLAIFG